MSTATTKVPTSKDEADIRAVIKADHKAHHNKDAAAIMAPYLQNAVIYDLAPPLSHQGMDLETKKAWLETWEGPIDRKSQDFNIIVSGDFSFSHGFYWHSGTSKAAARAVSFWRRATVCPYRERGARRIVHEHTSVPFYVDGSLRPAFDLKP